MTLLYIGGEDSDIVGVGATSVSTTAGTFRADYARCSLTVNGLFLGIPQAQYWRQLNHFTSSDFWISAQCWSNAGGGALSGASGLSFPLRFVDSSAKPRLQLTGVGNSWSAAGPYILQKIASDNTQTQLGVGNFTLFSDSSLNKIDMHIHYAVSGSVSIYVNSVLVFTYTGDVTTNSVTELTGFDLGILANVGCSGASHWSELIVSTTDTRTLSVVTLAPSGAGNASQWAGDANGDTVNEIVLNDSDGISSDTANQLEQFTVNGLPSGGFSIQGVTVAARTSTTPTAPQNLDLSLRLSGSNYFSPDQPVAASLDRISYIWETNPNTSAPFVQGDITGLEIGVKSIA